MQLLHAQLRLWWPALAIVSGLTLLLAVTLALDSPVFARTTTEIMVRIVAVVALYIFVGNSGILSFGHVAFMSVGAYASAWQTCCPAMKPFTMPGLPDFLRSATYPVLPALLASGLLTAAFAFIAGLVIMRLTGVAASIATFAMLFIVYVVYANWDSVTMGVSSIIGLPMYVSVEVAFAWACITVLSAYAFQISRFGLALRAAREDEVAARACGIRIYWQRVLAFTLSGFFMGIAGVLYGHYLGTIGVDTFFLELTFILLAMLIVGGMHSLSGAVAGVVVISAVIEILRTMQSGVQVGEWQFALPNGVLQIVLATLMLLILVFRPNGLSDGREIPWPYRRRASGTHDVGEALWRPTPTERGKA